MADSIGEFEVDAILRDYSVAVMAPSFFNVGTWTSSRKRELSQAIGDK